MNKTLLTLLSGMLCFPTVVFAQAPEGGAPFGFGGNQQSQTQAEYSEKMADINYCGDGKEYHNLDIYLPKVKKERYPVVIHIYGSAWFSNNSKGTADINTICAALLDAGYAVVTPNHRSSGDAKYPAQINDIKAVVRFLRANAEKYHLDPSFIGTSGFSSGAHLASLMATSNGVRYAHSGSAEYNIEGTLGQYTDYSSHVDACVEWSGPIDLLNMDCAGKRTMQVVPEEVVMGMPIEGHESNFDLLNSSYYIDAQDVPIGIFHGDEDNVVPCCQGERFYDALQKAGVSTFFVKQPKGGHGFNMYTPDNLKRMTSWFDSVRVAPKSRIVEEGGQGLYKAVMREEASLSAHTVFCPQDLSAFGPEHPLPVVVWGNGACTNSPWEHYLFLNEIASHGYLVIATGYYPETIEPYHGPMSSAAQQIESIDWAIAQNENPESPYYQKIDTRHIAAAGMSCGGLQTLFNCADPRISTLMVCNSGLFIDANAAIPNMPMPGKEKLNEIHTPVIYILGGETDIAYRNGMDDFHRISHVPAFAANLPVGHGGTYGQPHGGEFAVPAVAWLEWIMRGDKTAAKMFKGKKCGLSQREGWTVEKNKLLEKVK